MCDIIPCIEYNSPLFHFFYQQDIIVHWATEVGQGRGRGGAWNRLPWLVGIGCASSLFRNSNSSLFILFFIYSTRQLAPFSLQLLIDCKNVDNTLAVNKLTHLPEGATGGSSTELVAGMGIFSWPPLMSSHTNLIYWNKKFMSPQWLPTMKCYHLIIKQFLNVPSYFWYGFRDLTSSI